MCVNYSLEWDNYTLIPRLLTAGSVSLYTVVRLVAHDCMLPRMLSTRYLTVE